MKIKQFLCREWFLTKKNALKSDINKTSITHKHQCCKFQNFHFKNQDHSCTFYKKCYIILMDCIFDLYISSKNQIYQYLGGIQTHYTFLNIITYHLWGILLHNVNVPWIFMSMEMCSHTLYMLHMYLSIVPTMIYH
jgi:hypothetical protein